MRLFIAEKPSMGREIAQSIGSPNKHDGYIECSGGNVVTWLFGHLMEMLEPDEYDEAYKKWSLATLPFVPDVWKLKVKTDAKKQFAVIRKLVEQADSIVHAGDIDREGQLLVDELLEYLKCKKPTQRLLLSSMDAVSVKKSLNNLKDNKDFQNKKDAALARSRADFLIGINGTRAMTLTGQQQGYSGVLSIGRVQTPTLALIVARDLEIENFKPQDFLVPRIQVKHQNGIFWATWQPREDQDGLDSENRLVDPRIAEAIKNSASGQHGAISDYSAIKKKKAAPLPHSLATLQKAANAKYGLGAAATLETVQELYEQKITTYPRSECQYLTDEQFAEAPAILEKLSGDFPEVQAANPQIKSKAWSTSKVTEHHAIIPTGAKLNGCSDVQRKVFGLILQAYAQQFFPEMEYLAKKVVVDLANEYWSATGKTVINKGWTAFGDNTDDDESGEENQGLPDPMGKGDLVDALQSVIEKRQTKPPSRFTEGTLIEAMGSVHRFVTNPEIKKKLKETSGIGTPATRANIIETLFSRDYLIHKGKQVISTATGRNVVRTAPHGLTDPGITALWEQILDEIEKGNKTCDYFVGMQIKILPDIIQQISEAQFDKKMLGNVQPCPKCGKAMKKVCAKKKKSFLFWVCTADCGQPALIDENGRPGRPFAAPVDLTNAPKAPCPESGCTEQMSRIESTKKAGYFYWRCPNSKHPLCGDDNGKPGNPFGDKKKSKAKPKSGGR